MTDMTFREIGDRLASAFRLAARPLAVYGTDTRPADAIHLAEVNRCLAVSMFRMATDNPADAVYLTGGEQEGCCLGGLTHMGFIAPPEHIRYFVSTGRADIMNGAAEYLKATPELVERSLAAEGTITPPSLSPGALPARRSSVTLQGWRPPHRRTPHSWARRTQRKITPCLPT
jgi:uncharacterized protein (DUF169 family)